LATEKRKKYEDRRDSFHEIARAGGAGGQATKNDGLPHSESAVQLFLGYCASQGKIRIVAQHNMVTGHGR
jgi:hypothetical protein